MDGQSTCSLCRERRRNNRDDTVYAKLASINHACSSLNVVRSRLPHPLASYTLTIMCTEYYQATELQWCRNPLPNDLEAKLEHW